MTGFIKEPMSEKLFHTTNEAKHYLETADYGLMGVTCYKGCLVYKVHGWYEVLGKQVITPQEVDTIIRGACKIISESITVPCMGGGNVCVNDKNIEP